MTVFLLNHGPVDIATMLRQANLRVWTSIADVPVQTRQVFNFNALESVNAMILEIGHPTPELQYILAQAVVLRRPTLCLYTKDKEPRDILNQLNSAHLPKCMNFKTYTRATVDIVIHRFLNSLDKTIHLEDTPNIKFTLRLTPGIDDYLQWLARQKKINKAEHIRKLIREDSEKDDNYQQSIH
ncbi:MAG: hypothetical protein ACD_43C00275G0005 [uncultured bacterium]|nr:MAG: hypothetical protein ACD_43C00275G0005 [uncultured bacterium]